MIGLPENLGLNGQNYNAILVVVNRFTKITNFIPITKYLNTISLARLINRQIYSRYGVPKGIVNDRNPLFINKFWSELCDVTETKCKLSTAYHPQTNGQTKRINQELCRYLRNYITNKADTWSRVLHKAEFAYNNQKHSITQVLPFRALYGYNPRWITSIMRTDPKVQGVKKRLKNIRRIRTLIMQN